MDPQAETIQVRARIHTVMADRGYGFLMLESGKQAFFHCRDLHWSQRFGIELIDQIVKCDVRKTDRGLRASKIIPASIQ